MPNTPFSQRQSDPNGVGPFQFKLDGIASGETKILDLREMEKGKYVSLSPAGYDNLQVTNQNSSNPVTVSVNETGAFTVPSNTIESLDQQGMFRIEVTNTGGTAIAAGEVTVEIMKSAYTDDQQAREQNARPAVLKLLGGLL